MKNRIIDFDEEFEDIKKSINTLSTNIIKMEHSSLDNSKDISKLEDEIKNISAKMNMSIVHTQDPRVKDKKIVKEINQEINSFFIDYGKNIKNLDLQLEKEIYNNPRLLPELSALDISVIGIAGLLATLIDIFIVAIPKDMNYLGKYQQSGSELTGWIKTLGIDENGKLNPFLQWLEDNAKTPFDKSINDGGINNFYPGNHRMLNLAHDPLFGIIFGIIDMLKGQMTVIDGKGIIHVIKTYDMPTSGKIFSPIIWLAHIVSDICTSRGVPIPGSGFTQLLQFGSFGQNDRSIADITRWMYENGYDLRHFATMSTVPASIEMIIRIYHSMSIDKQNIQSNIIPLVDREANRIQNDLKLHKMLFGAHTIASAGNAMKVFSMSGNPSAINITEWGMLLKESIAIAKAVTRDTTVEKIQRNRKAIDQKWNELAIYYKL